MRHVDFENIEEKFDKTLTTKEWKIFEKDFLYLSIIQNS